MQFRHRLHTTGSGNDGQRTRGDHLRDGVLPPASITVNVGETVTWVFDDNGMAHDVNGLGGDAKGKLRSPLKKSGTYTYTFTEPGTYDYTCTPHPEMRGTVVVETP